MKPGDRLEQAQPWVRWVVPVSVLVVGAGVVLLVPLSFRASLVMLVVAGCYLMQVVPQRKAEPVVDKAEEWVSPAATEARAELSGLEELKEEFKKQVAGLEARLEKMEKEAVAAGRLGEVVHRLEEAMEALSARVEMARKEIAQVRAERAGTYSERHEANRSYGGATSEPRHEARSYGSSSGESYVQGFAGGVQRPSYSTPRSTSIPEPVRQPPQASRPAREWHKLLQATKEEGIRAQEEFQLVQSYLAWLFEKGDELLQLRGQELVDKFRTWGPSLDEHLLAQINLTSVKRLMEQSPFNGTSEEAERFARELEARQREIREFLRQQGFERIEAEQGQPLVPHLIDHSQAPDEPTSQERLSGTIYRIEPGEGGYRKDGQVLWPSRARVYAWQPSAAG